MPSAPRRGLLCGISSRPRHRYSVAPRLTDAKLRLRRGAPTLTLTASEAASVTVRLQRRVDGRWRTVRTTTKPVAAGTSRLKLGRRVADGKHRTLVVASELPATPAVC